MEQKTDSKNITGKWAQGLSQMTGKEIDAMMNEICNKIDQELIESGDNVIRTTSQSC
jgi:hypothetical protein